MCSDNTQQQSDSYLDNGNSGHYQHVADDSRHYGRHTGINDVQPGRRLGQAPNSAAAVNDLDSSNRPPPEGSVPTSLVVVVGSAGAIVALLVVISIVAVFGIRRGRRRDKHRFDAGAGLGVPVESYALVQSSSMPRHHRLPGDPLPAPDSVGAVDDVIVIAPTPSVSRANSAQRRAWESMLSSSNNAVDDVIELDCYSDGECRAGIRNSPSLPRALTNSLIGPRNRSNMADGGMYHSGDSVDDVIERIDFSKPNYSSTTTPRINRGLHR